MICRGTGSYLLARAIKKTDNMSGFIVLDPGLKSNVIYNTGNNHPSDEDLSPGAPGDQGTEIRKSA